MNQKTTIMLLTALLAGVTFLVGYKQGWWLKDEPKDSRVGKRLLDPAPPNSLINYVELARPGKDRVVARLTDGKWRLVEPVQAPGDGPKIEQLINAFKDLTVSAVYAPGSPDTPSLADVELDQPRAVLVIRDESGAEYRLNVGLTQNRTYVAVAGDPNIYGVDPDLPGRLNIRPADLRDNEIWPFSRDKIASASFTSPEQSVTVAQPSLGTWTIVKPVAAPADESKVAELVGKVVNLRAADWIDETGGSARTYGLDQPRLTVEMKVEVAPAKPAATQPEVRPAEPAKYETRTFALGASVGGQVFAQVDGKTIVALKADDADGLKVSLDELRDKRLVPLSRSDAAIVTVADPDGRTLARLMKVKDAWQMTVPISGPADTAAVNDWLDKVVSLKALSFEDQPSLAGQAAVRQPQMTVEIARSPDDKSPIKLIVGQPASATGAMTYLHNPAYPSLALVRSGDLKDVQLDPLTLADKQVWTVEEDRIATVSRSGPGMPGRTASRIPDNWTTWKLAGTDIPADADAIKTLLGKISNVKAQQQTTLTPDQAGLGKPDLTLTLTVRSTSAAATQPEEVTRKLALARKDGKLFGQADSTGPVHQFNPALLDDLSTEWADRKLVGKLDAEKASRLAIIAPGGTTELSRTGDSWSLKSDPNLPIDKSKVDEVIKNLSELSVRRYVDFDANDLARFGLDKPAVVVEIGFDGDAKPIVLKASAHRGDIDGNYAVRGDKSAVGVIPQPDLDRVVKDWKFFEKSH